MTRHRGTLQRSFLSEASIVNLPERIPYLISLCKSNRRLFEGTYVGGRSTLEISNEAIVFENSKIFLLTIWLLSCKINT